MGVERNKSLERKHLKRFFRNSNQEVNVFDFKEKIKRNKSQILRAEMPVV